MSAERGKIGIGSEHPGFEQGDVEAAEKIAREIVREEAARVDASEGKAKELAKVLEDITEEVERIAAEERAKREKNVS